MGATWLATYSHRNSWADLIVVEIIHVFKHPKPVVSNTDGDILMGVVRLANDVGRQHPSLACRGSCGGGGGTECLTMPVKDAGTILGGSGLQRNLSKSGGVLGALTRCAHGRDGISQS